MFEPVPDASSCAKNPIISARGFARMRPSSTQLKVNAGSRRVPVAATLHKV